MAKNKTNNSIYETIRKMRGDWGNVNPVTKVIPNKKKNYQFEDDYNYDLEQRKADLYEEDDYYFEDWGDC